MKPLHSLVGRRTAAVLVSSLAIALLAGADEPDPFTRRRTAVVTAHDANKDGRLDDAERERMRQALWKARIERKPDYTLPPDFLAKYDASKDGEMQPGEWKVAWDAETRILKETYDRDKDGTLGKAERAAMMTDVQQGKLTDVPAYFAGRMAEDASKAETDFLDAAKANLKFDTDGDGRASAAELERIRAERAKAR